MSNDRFLTWIASYPRSGNTWMRIFLANWMANSDQPININELPIYGLGFSETEDLLWKFVCGKIAPTEEEQIRRRVEVQRAIPDWARQLQEGGTGKHFFVKIHSFRGTINGYNTVAEDATHRSVYIIRDPRKVALSFASLTNRPVAEVVDMMADNQAKLGDRQAFQFLASWSFNVWSWQPHSLVIRQEDLPHAFRQVVNYLGLGHDEDRFQRAVKFSTLSELQRQESERGFREAQFGKFFGEKHAPLPEDLKRKIERDHGDVMRAYGYLK